MKRITVTPSDKFVSIDGKGKSPLEFQCPENVHAFQWYETFGEIEFQSYFDGEKIVKPPNEIVASYVEFQPAVDAWEAAPEIEEGTFVEPTAGEEA